MVDTGWRGVVAIPAAVRRRRLRLLALFDLGLTHVEIAARWRADTGQVLSVANVAYDLSRARQGFL